MCRPRDLLLCLALGLPAGAQRLRFADVTSSAGLTTVHRTVVAPDPLFDWFLMYGGCAAIDFDRDGWQDLWVAGGGRRPDRLFHNEGDGAFIDVAEKAGLAELHVAGGVAVGDFDDDGWVDLFVTSIGPPENLGTGHHRLWRNGGDGTFTDVAQQAGVSSTSPVLADGFGASWGDYDLDGDLDLAVAGWHALPLPSYGNRLFRNDGDGTFTDVTAAAGLDLDEVHGFSPRFCDMDGDRWPELLWTADFGTSTYLVNRGDGTFADWTALSGTGLDGNGMGAAVGDFDGNGLFDWYVTSIWDDDGHPFAGTGNKLYLNQGGHAYAEVASSAGVDVGYWGWGTVASDLDDDGDLDLVENNGWPLLGPDFDHRPARLWRNRGDATFDEVSAEAGLTYSADGRALLQLDYDRDGDRDLVLYGNRSPLALFRNERSGPATHWLTVELSTRARPDLAPHGFGSRVEITAGGRRQAAPAAWGTGYLSQSALDLHFGLGQASRVERLEVVWPDGSRTVRTDLEADRVLRVEAP